MNFTEAIHAIDLGTYLTVHTSTGRFAGRLVAVHDDHIKVEQRWALGNVLASTTLVPISSIIAVVLGNEGSQ